MSARVKFRWTNKAPVNAVMERAGEAVAQEVAWRAQALAPVRTGRLRESIGWTRDGRNFVVGSDVPYAVYVEVGTYKMAAQPYLGPALEQVRRKWGLR